MYVEITCMEIVNKEGWTILASYDANRGQKVASYIAIQNFYIAYHMF